ncbi:c-type cytochrome [Hydrotalea sandarakina]|jgi:cytochrome c553|uniref:Cytochrome c n=1 Tax=Hydrotalea sandarakina TaxID=1004304 RepID=A0A2W7RWA2_9BACT|nr:cytochrome c [Hydrotalea sandarakina]PZX62760.1 cytochrome c [Hydrotalea sandarakina]
MKKILIWVGALLLLMIAAVFIYLQYVLPNVGNAPELTVDITPQRVQHGAYLANHVTVCMDCHSTRNWKKYTGPITPGTEGKGGEYFGEELGFPGKFYSKNITPANLSTWTDGEIYRVITTGVDKNGHAIFPVMPYPYYGNMDKEDVLDIIAYIRSLHPIQNVIPPRSIQFPMNLILNTIPQKAVPMAKPKPSDTIAYGNYLVSIAACMECHTMQEKGNLIKDMAFAGGRLFKMPNGNVYSANITPDKETGIGNWTRESFIARFKTYSDTANLETMTDKKINTIMPWSMYGGMDTNDLSAIYAYLKTLKPLKNKVQHFEIITMK